MGGLGLDLEKVGGGNTIRTGWKFSRNRELIKILL